MDRTTLVVSLCLAGSSVLLALLLLTADLLRHAWDRERRLRRSVRYAQTVVSDYVACCRKCGGQGTITAADFVQHFPASVTYPGAVTKCSACYNGREFLHMSADL